MAVRPESQYSFQSQDILLSGDSRSERNRGEAKPLSMEMLRLIEEGLVPEEFAVSLEEELPTQVIEVGPVPESYTSQVLHPASTSSRARLQEREEEPSGEPALQDLLLEADSQSTGEDLVLSEGRAEDPSGEPAIQDSLLEADSQSTNEDLVLAEGRAEDLSGEPAIQDSLLEADSQSTNEDSVLAEGRAEDLSGEPAIQDSLLESNVETIDEDSVLAEERVEESAGEPAIQVSLLVINYESLDEDLVLAEERVEESAGEPAIQDSFSERHSQSRDAENLFHAEERAEESTSETMMQDLCSGDISSRQSFGIDKPPLVSFEDLKLDALVCTLCFKDGEDLFVCKTCSCIVCSSCSQCMKGSCPFCSSNPLLISLEVNPPSPVVKMDYPLGDLPDFCVVCEKPYEAFTHCNQCSTTICTSCSRTFTHKCPFCGCDLVFILGSGLEEQPPCQLRAFIKENLSGLTPGTEVVTALTQLYKVSPISQLTPSENPDECSFCAEEYEDHTLCENCMTTLCLSCSELYPGWSCLVCHLRGVDSPVLKILTARPPSPVECPICFELSVDCSQWVVCSRCSNTLCSECNSGWSGGCPFCRSVNSLNSISS